MRIEHPTLNQNEQDLLYFFPKIFLPLQPFFATLGFICWWLLRYLRGPWRLSLLSFSNSSRKVLHPDASRWWQIAGIQFGHRCRIPVSEINLLTIVLSSQIVIFVPILRIISILPSRIFSSWKNIGSIH